MNFFKLRGKDYFSLSARMSSFDNIFVYPLGLEAFKICHGENYFHFFERLGKLRFTGFEEEGKIAIVAASILRTINKKKVWYLCDLKVHPQFRNRYLTTKLIYRNFLPQLLISRKCYGISMNTPGESNRTLGILNNLKFKFFESAGNIIIYSMTRLQLDEVLPLIGRYKGSVGSVSLKGIKDIILQSTKKPMRLNHLVFDSGFGIGRYDNNDGADDVYMFCTAENSNLNKELAAMGVEGSSTATIVHHGMKVWNWEFINTSEI